MKTSTQTQHQLTSNEGDAVLLERMTLTGDLQGYALRLTLTQHYRNDSAHAIEAVYTFPVAAGATLAGLEAVIAGKRLVGQVMPRTEAETRYEKAIDEGDLPVMVERSGRGLYTANLGGIAGGDPLCRLQCGGRCHRSRSPWWTRHETHGERGEEMRDQSWLASAAAGKTQGS